MAAGAFVPEEHHVRAAAAGRREEQGRRRRRRRQQVVDGRRRVREGEPGRRAVPAQGGPQDVRELPGAVQGAREDVQLLHHWKLWVVVSRDERHEREQAGGPAERLRVRADLRGQGRRLDARRRRAMGDVRRVVQAPPDHEGFRSHWPRTKGHGEMQEQQKLRRTRTHAAGHPVSIALVIVDPVSYITPQSSNASLISEFIMVGVSTVQSVRSSESVSVQVSSCHILQKREAMNMYLVPKTMSFCFTFSSCSSFPPLFLAQNAKAPCSQYNQGALLHLVH